MATSMLLTQVYLEPAQKKALTSQAKRSGRSVSELMRDAVDAAVAGVTTDELKLLDEGTKRAKGEIDTMLKLLQKNSKEHAAFMRDIAALREESA
jgi:Ribbon-helix-helix protein, copG family